jgi:hypothetical protein
VACCQPGWLRPRTEEAWSHACWHCRPVTTASGCDGLYAGGSTGLGDAVCATPIAGRCLSRRTSGGEQRRATSGLGGAAAQSRGGGSLLKWPGDGCSSGLGRGYHTTRGSNGGRPRSTRAAGYREARATRRTATKDEVVETPVETCQRSNDAGSWRRLTPAWRGERRVSHGHRGRRWRQ